MVKLRQIMQNPEIVATKGLGFLFFSIYFRFFVFFFSIVLCVFVFDSCRFSFTNHKFDKIQELQKKICFFVFVSVFSRCFSMFFELFSNRKNIDIFNLFADYMFESQKQFSIYIFELFSKLRKKCELFPILKHMLILFMPLPVRLPQ